VKLIEQQSSRAAVKKGAILFILFFCCTVALLLYCYNDAHALDIEKKPLPNGLTVIHVERHNLPIVMVTLLIDASPLHEPKDKAGLANLTARMLTEGTFKRSASEISEEIEFIGASLSASTLNDYTTLSLSVLKKDVEKAFEIFSDVLLNPSFPEDELKRQKELIKGSIIRSEDDPSFVASRAFIKEVFGDHPYGRLIDGSIETIDAITRDDVLSFYKEHYLPDRAILSVVGDITSEELGFLIEKYLGQWRAEDRSQKTEVRRQTEKKLREKKIVVIDRDITQANIIIGHRGISRDNPDFYAVSVMNYILGGGGFASRLMTTVRDEMGLTYSIHSSFRGRKEPGQFEVVVQTKNEFAGIAVKEILAQMNTIRKEPVTDEELEDAKLFLTGSFPMRLETNRRIADFLAVKEFYNLGDDYIEKYPEYINSVTKEDVLRVAQKYLDPENYVLVIVGNKDKIKPEIKTN
jgi:zinc protease